MTRKAVPVEEILAGATEVNGAESRANRLNLLNNLKQRLEDYLHFFASRAKGPSLKEMDRAVEDIETTLEHIKKYDQD